MKKKKKKKKKVLATCHQFKLRVKEYGIVFEN